MKKSVKDYPLIEQDLKQYENIKTISINSIMDNYVFPKEEKDKNTLTEAKTYDLESWKKLIEKLNWNF